MVRILLADDHAMVRGGLKQIFATTADIAVVGEATQAGEVSALLSTVACDLLVLDIKMPGMSGIELVRRLRDERPALPILILSMHNEVQIVSRALKAGASGYVTKDSEPEILLQAVRKLAAGGKFIDPVLVDAMVFDGTDEGRLRPPGLTPREVQVLRLIGDGLPLNSIAEQLNLSPKTVSTHKMRLMKKLGISNNAELIRHATRYGVIFD